MVAVDIPSCRRADCPPKSHAAQGSPLCCTLPIRSLTHACDGGFLSQVDCQAKVCQLECHVAAKQHILRLDVPASGATQMFTRCRPHAQPLLSSAAGQHRDLQELQGVCECCTQKPASTGAVHAALDTMITPSLRSHNNQYYLCAMPAECRNCRPRKKGCSTSDTVTRSVRRPLLLSMKDHKSP